MKAHAVNYIRVSGRGQVEGDGQPARNLGPGLFEECWPWN
jgi:hypothetical protein